MAKPGPTTQAKRNRERARQEKQQNKRVERAQRKEDKKLAGDGPESDEDPDLVGIVPGPQPITDIY